MTRGKWPREWAGEVAAGSAGIEDVPDRFLELVASHLRTHDLRVETAAQAAVRRMRQIQHADIALRRADRRRIAEGYPAQVQARIREIWNEKKPPPR